MRKFILTGLVGILAAGPVFVSGTPSGQEPSLSRMFSADTVRVPFGGNAWITRAGSQAGIAEKGLLNWTSAATVISAYFRVEKPGPLNLALRLQVPDGKSTIRVTVDGKPFTLQVSNSISATIDIGKISVKKAGYVRVDLQGMTKTGRYFAAVSDLILSGPAAKEAVFTEDNGGNYFYWGRRGPSVHLRYTIPEEAKDKIECFYNEITVPPGADIDGSYYMANGFGEGYFGMQVNSATERRVLFSIWSPFTTDDPKSIPDSLKIKLLKKGSGVQTGEFGDEGSGGQSYLVYPWKAGRTYAFLTHAKPDAASRTTIFTSYFKDLADADWTLVASFKRPQTATRLENLYSFLENFNSATGFRQRQAFYGNQWIRSTAGKWYELTGATFTADATARKNYRKDYAGGREGKNFYLRNCGFFAGFTPIDTKLQRTSSGKGEPVIPKLP